MIIRYRHGYLNCVVFWPVAHAGALQVPRLPPSAVHDTAPPGSQADVPKADKTRGLLHYMIVYVFNAHLVLFEICLRCFVSTQFHNGLSGNSSLFILDMAAICPISAICSIYIYIYD